MLHVSLKVFKTEKQLIAVENAAKAKIANVGAAGGKMEKWMIAFERAEKVEEEATRAKKEKRAITNEVAERTERQERALMANENKKAIIYFSFFALVA